MSDLLYQPLWRLIDQSSLGQEFKAKQSFATDDALCYSVGKGENRDVCKKLGASPNGYIQGFRTPDYLF